MVVETSEMDPIDPVAARRLGLRDALREVRVLIHDAMPEDRGALAGVAREIDAALEELSPSGEQPAAPMRRESSFPPPKRSKDLLSVICHDLKDPLASIVMGAGFLRRVLPADESMAAARRVVGAIQRSSDRMNNVIGDLHDLGKIESGDLTLETAPYDAATLVRAAFDVFAARAKERNIRLEVAATSAPLRVTCDRARLQLAFTKLLTNAMKFTEPGGAITLHLEPRGDRAWFAVVDTGRGIAPERLPTIFDREVNARQTPRDGPGLGLAIVKGIIDLHGGECGVESKVGAGSTLWFSLRTS